MTLLRAYFDVQLQCMSQITEFQWTWALDSTLKLVYRALAYLSKGNTLLVWTILLLLQMWLAVRVSKEYLTALTLFRVSSVKNADMPGKSLSPGDCDDGVCSSRTDVFACYECTVDLLDLSTKSQHMHLGIRTGIDARCSGCAHRLIVDLNYVACLERTYVTCGDVQYQRSRLETELIWALQQGSSYHVEQKPRSLPNSEVEKQPHSTRESHSRVSGNRPRAVSSAIFSRHITCSNYNFQISTIRLL